MRLHAKCGSRVVIRATFLLFLVGCSKSDEQVPVQGRVVFAQGDSSIIAGHSIEFAHTTETTLRASGTIGNDGRFSLETLHKGKLLKGAKPGTYNARLVFNDEGDGQTKRPAIPPRYLQFATSGWQATVPHTGDLEFTIASK